MQKAIFKILKQKITKQHELLYIFWECTTRCTLSCLHCGSDCNVDSNYKDMPFENFQAALNTIPENLRNKIVIAITGGEPLLRKDLAYCGMEIRKMGFQWGMVSNAFLYDQQKHSELLNAGIGALTFSLDGMKKNHNWLRNSALSFDRVDHAIDLVVKSPRINFDVVTCLNQRNINDLEEIYSYLLIKKVKQWRLFTISPIGRAKDNPELQLTPEQFKKAMNFIAEKRKESKMNVKFSCEGYVGKYEQKVRETYFFCRAGINIGSVLIDGSISACPNIDRGFVQGNIKTDNFYEIWQNRYEKFRNRNWTKQGICADCKDYNFCQGNGFHLWQPENPNVLVCHKKLTE